ncbi:hypothetical protein D9M69_523540 [compost metagenome]
MADLTVDGLLQNSLAVLQDLQVLSRIHFIHSLVIETVATDPMPCLGDAAHYVRIDLRDTSGDVELSPDVVPLEQVE